MRAIGFYYTGPRPVDEAVRMGPCRSAAICRLSRGPQSESVCLQAGRPYRQAVVLLLGPGIEERLPGYLVLVLALPVGAGGAEHVADECSALAVAHHHGCVVVAEHGLVGLA